LKGLPNIGSRAGQFELDSEYLKKANAEQNKLNAIADFDEPKLVEANNRTMAEVLKAKRE